MIEVAVALKTFARYGVDLVDHLGRLTIVGLAARDADQDYGSIWHIRELLLTDSHSPIRFRQLEHELFALDRYSNDEERKVLDQIHQIMIEKEDLDYRWAQGVALKYWLFIHVPLTYALMVFVAAHVLLVLGFDGRIG